MPKDFTSFEDVPISKQLLGFVLWFSIRTLYDHFKNVPIFYEIIMEKEIFGEKQTQLVEDACVPFIKLLHVLRSHSMFRQRPGHKYLYMYTSIVQYLIDI